MDESTGMTLFIRLLSTPLLSYHAIDRKRTKRSVVLCSFVLLSAYPFPANGISANDHKASDHWYLMYTVAPACRKRRAGSHVGLHSATCDRLPHISAGQPCRYKKQSLVPEHNFVVSGLYTYIFLLILQAMESVSRSLRMIPNVNECLHSLLESGDVDDIPLSRLKYCTRRYLEKIRQKILRGDPNACADRTIIIDGLAAFVRRYHRHGLTRVVNGTGVIVHTNLGRSLLPPSSTEALLLAGRSYTNLEFDLETGKRGSRYAHVEELLCELTGAEAALVVNNNAAAVLLTLETIAKNKEVVVSRGQLIEIGGSFRIPDIMKRSGALLIETGATNRTHVDDYRGAVTTETALLLRVHCSNYRIIGFTSEVSGPELVQLGKSVAVPVMEDLGSGCFIDLSRFGLAKEPTVQETVASGMDIVTFSGDKLLGGPQAGIIVGKRAYLDQIKKNPLNRAVRIDKFTLAALESILRLYLDEPLAVREIPTLAMIASSEETVRERANQCQQRVAAQMKDFCSAEVVQVQSRVGGGAMPEQNIPSWALAVRPSVMTIHQLEKSLRHSSVPVIGRVENDRFILDMRTVNDNELEIIVAGLWCSLAAGAGDKQGTCPGEKEQ